VKFSSYVPLSSREMHESWTTMVTSRLRRDADFEGYRRGRSTFQDTPHALDIDLYAACSRTLFETVAGRRLRKGLELNATSATKE